MNPIRSLRAAAGITQKKLAVAGGTSQPAIAAYESGTRSPTLRTLETLAASVGMEAVVSFVPRMSREDRRSLAFHRAIAALVERDPVPTISHAAQNVARLSDMHPHASVLFYRWRTWLALSPEEFTAKILDPGLEAREMRQVSPFSGLLSPKKRAEILRQFRQDERR